MCQEAPDHVLRGCCRQKLPRCKANSMMVALSLRFFLSCFSSAFFSFQSSAPHSSRHHQPSSHRADGRGGRKHRRQQRLAPRRRRLAVRGRRPLQSPAPRNRLLKSGLCRQRRMLSPLPAPSSLLRHLLHHHHEMSFFKTHCSKLPAFASTAEVLSKLCCKLPHPPSRLPGPR